MDRIVIAASRMASKPHKISQVTEGQVREQGIGTEIFFLYDDKHKWAIRSDPDGEHWLSYYPGDQDISSLAAVSDWADRPDYVAYSDTQMKSARATENFSRLYRVVEEKVHGMDKILDEIINEQD